jgi:hypothetical protein
MRAGFNLTVNFWFNIEFSFFKKVSPSPSPSPSIQKKSSPSPSPSPGWVRADQPFKLLQILKSIHFFAFLRAFVYTFVVLDVSTNFPTCSIIACHSSYIVLRRTFVFISDNAHCWQEMQFQVWFGPSKSTFFLQQ